MGLYFCWRSWTSCLDTWHHGFYQIPTDKKIKTWLPLLEILQWAVFGSYTRTTIQNKHQNKHKNGSLSTKWFFLPWLSQSSDLNPAENEWVNWREEKMYCHGAVNLKGLEWFWMKEWSLISCQVFSNLIRHYRRKLRAVILGKECRNTCGQHKLEKVFISQWDFPPTFNCFTSMLCWNFLIFKWKIKRINDADLFSLPPLLIFTKGCHFLLFFNVIYSCDGKAEFSASLLQFSVSNDPSESI